MALTWSRTFDERWPDFVAREDGQLAGRIYEFARGPRAGTWLWSACGVHRTAAEIGCALFGEARSMDEAATRVRHAWEQARAWSARTGRPLHLQIYREILAPREVA